MAVRAMGIMIFRMIMGSLASSSRAASMISSGICIKYCRSRKMPKALAIKGRIWGQKLWRIPALLNIR